MKYFVYSLFGILVLLTLSYILTRFVLRKNKTKTNKRIIIFLIIFTLSYTISSLGYLLPYYKADDVALTYLHDEGTLKYIDEDKYYGFINESSDTAVIFVPGSKVDSYAYSSLMKGIALNNVDVYVIKPLFHFPLFSVKEIEKMVESINYENIFIGGHSLGGYISSKCLYDKNVKGIFLLGAYPNENIRKDISLLSIYGDSDGILEKDKYEKLKEYWPIDSTEFVIKGANHSGYGYYELQKGDNEAAINTDEQIAITINKINTFIDAHR